MKRIFFSLLVLCAPACFADRFNYCTGCVDFTNATGGGSSSGTINAGAQYAVPYYSLPGSSTTLSASPILTNNGSTITLSAPSAVILGSSTAQLFGPNFGSGLFGLKYLQVIGANGLLSAQAISPSDIPGGATSYVRLTSTLQSGATFFVSSGTAGAFNASTLTIHGQGAGQIALREGEDSSVFYTGAGATTIWASSATHWLMFNPGGVSTEAVVGISTPITNGNIPLWAGQYQIYDSGLTPEQIKYYVEPATVTFLLPVGAVISTMVVTSSVSFPYVNSTVFENVSTMSLVDAYASFTSTGTSPVMAITANGTYGTTNGSSGGLFVNCSGGAAASGMCVQIYSNAGAQNALGGMLNIVNDNSAFNEPALYIQRTNNTNFNSDIRIEATGTPAITIIETGQPVGSSQKFQWSAHNGTSRLEGRNVADNAFDSAIIVSSMASYGDVSIGQGYSASNNTQFQVISATSNVYTAHFSTAAVGNFALAITTTGVVSIGNGGSLGKTVCWKTATTLGFCSSVVGVGGDCTCN